MVRHTVYWHNIKGLKWQCIVTKPVCFGVFFSDVTAETCVEEEGKRRGFLPSLQVKSPGREEPDITNRGRGMEGEREAKRDKGEEKRKKGRGGN